MALVAYDVSGSENEEEDEENNSKIIIIEKEKLNSTNISSNVNNNNSNNDDDIDEINKETSIGKLLPKAVKNETILFEDKLEDFIPKYKPLIKSKEKIKINIPSLLETENDNFDEPEIKRSKFNSKGSGLLSILPPVRGSPLTVKSFVPKILQQKSTTKVTDFTLMPNAVRKRAEIDKKNTFKKFTKDNEDTKKNDDSKQDENDLESDDDIDMPEMFDMKMWESLCDARKKKDPIKSTIDELQQSSVPEETIDIAPEPVKPYEGLDNEAFKELVGKNLRPHLNYKLIDINEEVIVADKEVWATKSLTDPDQTSSQLEMEEAVDPTRKKKHHITYLAEQAKANEQQLQSQWSANKFNRNQTRAKYGF